MGEKCVATHTHAAARHAHANSLNQPHAGVCVPVIAQSINVLSLATALNTLPCHRLSSPIQSSGLDIHLFEFVQSLIAFVYFLSVNNQYKKKRKCFTQPQSYFGDAYTQGECTIPMSQLVGPWDLLQLWV